MPEGADIEKFAGKPIKLFTIEGGIVDPTTIAYNIYSYEETDTSWDQLWDAFINDPRVSVTRERRSPPRQGLSIGAMPCRSVGAGVNAP